MRPLVLALIGLLLTAIPAGAKVDLVTLPDRDSVQLTIYNAADLTLVREQRTLTLKQGLNRLQFSWAGTLIDPTSLEMLPKEHADQILIQDLVFPAGTRNLGLWTIDSKISGAVPVEISYLTSGLSWRAFYLATLATDESDMGLEGFVRVENRSGEDYDNAQTRLIVGRVQVIDEVAALASREHPYGRPGEDLTTTGMDMERALPAAADMLKTAFAMADAPAGRVKEIVKEGLSEYFLYTIEGRETIPQEWAKRLPSFTARAVPVVNRYKFEEERWGRSVVRFLRFTNDKDHHLGDTPLPDGAMQVFRAADDQNHLAFEGRSSIKYIPVDQEAELDLGGVTNVTVEPTLMDFSTDAYLFDAKGNISGWDEVRQYKVTVKNTREVGVDVEITRNFPAAKWELAVDPESVPHEKRDLDTVRFSLKLPPRSEKTFTYTLTTRHGQRAD